ncbi:45ad46f3-2178-4f61-aa10-8a2e0cebd391-CDS [Sclerotinia trifoliorum]|uniref:Large ribosomal subunit protein bL21m n=1 Tax=Sclerotinia trifoliorum TaxID=28548 RepID=A0A8H2VYA1_9HELO|nr:45ad46f3-2178-4f61-aa10-8a2e0cebd391-CDS [Sclerotinia trifoliorum]
MFSRTIRKSLLDVRIPSATLPPTSLLPSRVRFFNSTTQHVESPIENSNASPLSSTASLKPVDSSIASSKPVVPSPSIAPLSLSPSVKEMLPFLTAQPSHFITTHIYSRPYLVTVGDTVRLPFRMPGVVPGDVLRLNTASSIGSRDYTLKGTPYLDERIFECRARVMGTEAEPMRTKEKTKRRNRKIKTVKSKHKYTILRIAELRVKSVEEIEG